MKTLISAVALTALTVAAVAVYPKLTGVATSTGRPPVVSGGAPVVEVVFVLDTTGSMSGMIDAAREKIWSIASSMAAAQPVPEFRMGLVAYRDRGDAYVTRVVDLSDDLDTVYAELIDFAAAGGGDGPESVNAALFQAVHSISWSQDESAYRAIFLVGDSPPHNYPDEAGYPETLDVAASRGIVVNTIRCGNNATTEHVWRQIAGLSQGSFFSVDQSGGALAVTTPFDRALADTSAALDATRLVYGDAEIREHAVRKAAATDKLHAQASEAARARRATFNAQAGGAGNLYGDNDLVADVAAGEVALTEIEEDELPAAIRTLPPAEREDFLINRAAEREALSQRLAALADQRDAYLREQTAGMPDTASSLDYQVFETVRAQAAGKGLVYGSAPKL